MATEIRRVIPSWEHPRNTENGNYIPLLDDKFNEQLKKWEEGKAKWDEGFVESHYVGTKEKWIPIPEEHKGITYEKWDGKKPQKEWYMPHYPVEEKTHYQAYENVSEGTPRSPVFASLEDMAAWYVKQEKKYTSNKTGTYEEWLSFFKGNVNRKKASIPKKEYILCSAIWYKDVKTAIYNPTNIKQGTVVCGHRHPHCIHAMKALTGLRTVTYAIDGAGRFTQGFLTNLNRFVDRKEGGEIAFEAKQTEELKTYLYSEDLY